MSRNIILVDLGFGDSGKGSITDALTRFGKYTGVVKYSGGSQCAHNVVLPNGIHHTFSQFGSGTFSGAKTFISKYFLVNPISLYNENEILRTKGIKNGLDKVFIHEDARIVTPFHAELNMMRENARGKNKHGSTGSGIGETVDDSLRRPDKVLRAKHLKFGWPEMSIFGILLETYLALDKRAIEEIGKPLTSCPTNNKTRILELAKRYVQIQKTVNIVSDEQWNELIRKESLVFEGGQGVLLDENYGFHPYTTWSTTTSANAEQILKDADINERPTKLGIMRTYMTRHGAGPFPTEFKNVWEKLFQDPVLEEKHNKPYQWAGAMRFGWLDLCLLKYAILATKGVDGLAITHCDTLKQLKTWPICNDYWFNPYSLPKNLKEQQDFTDALMETTYKELSFSEVKAENVLNYIKFGLNLPIMVESHGPTHLDKIWH